MVCDAMERHSVRKLVVQVGGFTLLEGEAPPPAFLACCVRDLYLSAWMGETVALADNQRIADNLEKRKATIDWTLARPGMLKHGGDAAVAMAIGRANGNVIVGSGGVVAAAAQQQQQQQQGGVDGDGMAGLILQRPLSFVHAHIRPSMIDRALAACSACDAAGSNTRLAL